MDSGSVSVFTLGVTTTIGAGMGAVLSAMISSRSAGQAGSGALVQAASEMTQRMMSRNEELINSERRTRRALIELSDAVQVVLHEQPHVSDATLDRLRSALRKGQEAL